MASSGQWGVPGRSTAALRGATFGLKSEPAADDDVPRWRRPDMKIARKIPVHHPMRARRFKNRASNRSVPEPQRVLARHLDDCHRPSSKPLTTLRSRPPARRLESNSPSLHQTLGDSADVLVATVDPGGKEAANALRRLIDLKDTAHYGLINVSREKLTAALRQAGMLVEFAGATIRR